jgi:hypothetical protein
VEGWAFDPAADEGRCEVDVLIEGRATATCLSSPGDGSSETRRISLELASLLREERQEIELRFTRTGVTLPHGRFDARTPIPPSRRLLGVNGYRFDKGVDDRVLNDLSGRTAPDLAAIESLAALLTGLDLRIAAWGGRLTVLIAPDRMAVDPTKVARHFVPYPGRSSRVLVERLMRWGVEVVDPVDALRGKAASRAIMPKTDDRLGPAAISDLIAAVPGLEHCSAWECLAATHEAGPPRLCGALADPGCDEPGESPAAPIRDRVRFHAEDRSLAAELMAGATAMGDVLVCGGDLARSLSHLARQGFAKVGYVRPELPLSSMIDDLRPSHVIVVLTESDLVMWKATEGACWNSATVARFLEAWRSGSRAQFACLPRQELRQR